MNIATDQYLSNYNAIAKKTHRPHQSPLPPQHTPCAAAGACPTPVHAPLLSLQRVATQRKQFGAQAQAMVVLLPAQRPRDKRAARK